MVKLTIKSDDYGLALYKDGKPWFYYKDGNCVVSLLKVVVPICDDIEYMGEISIDDREQEFA